MARYFLTKSTLSGAATEAIRQAKRDTPACVYVVSQTQPPLFLVGPPTMDMEEAGATALFTVVPGLPDGDVRQRNHELEQTVKLLKDLNAELQAEVTTLKHHLNPKPQPRPFLHDGMCWDGEDRAP